MNSEACPSDELLFKFNEGRLVDADIDRIANHLADCSGSCLERLESFAPGSLEAGFQSSQQETLPIRNRAHLDSVVGKIIQQLNVSAIQPQPDKLGLELYEVNDPVAISLLAETFLTEDYLGSLVQLHRSRADTLFSREQISQFLYDACDGRLLEHPNIVPIMEIGAWDNSRCYYITPHIEAPSLDQFPELGQPLSLDDAFEIFQQVAAAIQYSHSRDVIHRHLSPETIQISPGPVVTVHSFGMVFDSRYQLDLVVPHEQLTEFQSPEVKQNSKTRVDFRSDVYSLGAIMYWLFKQTGQRLNPGLAVFKPLVKQAMESSRRDRYQSVDELLVHFESAITQFNEDGS